MPRYQQLDLETQTLHPLQFCYIVYLYFRLMSQLSQVKMSSFAFVTRVLSLVLTFGIFGPELSWKSHLLFQSELGGDEKEHLILKCIPTFSANACMCKGW